MEILVRIIDKDQPDPRLAPTASKRGDVITVQPDGWVWSQAELANPDWRIIRAPILSTLTAALLTPPHEELDIIAKENRRRDWMIDFSLLPDPSLFTGKRTTTIIDLTKNQVTSACIQKPIPIK